MYEADAVSGDEARQEYMPKAAKCFNNTQACARFPTIQGPLPNRRKRKRLGYLLFIRPLLSARICHQRVVQSRRQRSTYNLLVDQPRDSGRDKTAFEYSSSTMCRISDKCVG